VARLRRRLNVRAPRRAPRRRRRALPARARPPRRAPRRRRRALPACARPLRRAASRLQPRAQPRRRVCATKSAPPRSGGWEDRWYKERRPTPGLSCARGVLQGSADGHGELTACLDLALHEQVHWHQGCNQQQPPRVRVALKQLTATVVLRAPPAADPGRAVREQLHSAGVEAPAWPAHRNQHGLVGRDCKAPRHSLAIDPWAWRPYPGAEQGRSWRDPACPPGCRPRLCVEAGVRDRSCCQLMGGAGTAASPCEACEAASCVKRSCQEIHAMFTDLLRSAASAEGACARAQAQFTPCRRLPTCCSSCTRWRLPSPSRLTRACIWVRGRALAPPWPGWTRPCACVARQLAGCACSGRCSGRTGRHTSRLPALAATGGLRCCSRATLPRLLLRPRVRRGAGAAPTQQRPQQPAGH